MRADTCRQVIADEPNTMRRFLLLVVVLAMCMVMHAQGYCFDIEGTRLEYVRKYPRDGKFCWRHILTVTEVETKGSTQRIVSTSGFFKANGKPLNKGDMIEVVFIDEHDNVRGDLGEAVASYVKSRTGLKCSGTGSITVLPSDMQPGDTLPMASATVKVGPLKYQVKVYDRKVLREETISVPAGTFKCIVLEENRIESGPGHNKNVRNLTWYSKGIGFVRHDTYVDGVLDTSEILYDKN